MTDIYSYSSMSLEKQVGESLDIRLGYLLVALYFKISTTRWSDLELVLVPSNVFPILSKGRLHYLGPSMGKQLSSRSNIPTVQ
jgi:hypothetical protein